MDLNGASVAAPIAKAVQAAASEPAAPSDLSVKPLGATKNPDTLVDRDNSAAQAEVTPDRSPKPAQLPATGAPAVSEAPKPASVEDVPDAESANAIAGTISGKPAAENADTTSKTNGSAGKPADESSEPAKPDTVPAQDAAAMGKPPSSVENNPSKAPQSETLSGETSQAAPEAAAATAEVGSAPAPGPVSVSPTSGEREAAPQATPPESKPDDGKKRKADALDPDVVPTSVGSDGQLTEGADTANKKRKPGRPPGRPPAASNGNSKAGHENHEGLGHKLAKKAKKVLPTMGRTERKTRSQGPA